MLRKLMIAATASLVLVVAASPAAASRYTGSHGAAHHRTGGDRYTDPLDGIHYVDPLEGGQYTNPLGHDHYTDPLGRGGHKHGKTVSSAGLNKYLRYCGAESRTRHSGRTATPFSLCVSAMAKLANGKARSAVKACKAESKRHVKGSKATPFSRCVVAGNRLLKDKRHAAHRHSKR